MIKHEEELLEFQRVVNEAFKQRDMLVNELSIKVKE